MSQSLVLKKSHYLVALNRFGSVFFFSLTFIPPFILLQGDSGGPLVCPAGSGSGHWVALGVTSWGKGCGRSWGNNSSCHPSRRGSPGFFTDVRLLLPWIKRKLREGRLRYGCHKIGQADCLLQD